MMRFLVKAAVPLAISSAALALFTPSQSQAEPTIRERIATAIETVEGACGSDIQNFCGKVTRGDGRLLTCMQAFDDQLNRRCQWALYRVSRQLEGTLDRVQRLADACWNEIETHCRDAERIGQCIMSKRDSLSPECGKVASTLKRALQGFATLRGLQVIGSDNSSLGAIIDVKRGPDGAVQAIEVEMDQMLGIGGKVVTITADKFEQVGDEVRLLLKRDDIRNLPEVKSK